MYIYITGFAGTNGTDLEILILLLFPLYQTLPVGLMCGNIRHREEDIYMHNGSTQSRGDLLVDISLHSIKFYLPRRNQVPYMMQVCYIAIPLEFMTGIATQFIPC